MVQLLPMNMKNFAKLAGAQQTLFHMPWCLSVICHARNEFHIPAKCSTPPIVCNATRRDSVWVPRRRRHHHKSSTVKSSWLVMCMSGGCATQQFFSSSYTRITTSVSQNNKRQKKNRICKRNNKKTKKYEGNYHK